MLTLIILAVWLLSLTIAITVHEFAHAYTADKLGDPTARLQDRLSLNPLRHYDQLGTTLLLVTATLRALGLPIIPFGWAKPVQFDPYNLQNPRRDAALISLAGPIANFLVAGIISLLLHLLVGSTSSQLLVILATPIIMLNVVLGLFNLVPVHPLDGGKILVGLLPRDLALEAEHILHQYGLLILLLLIMPFGGTSPIFHLLGPAIDFLMSLLLP